MEIIEDAADEIITNEPEAQTMLPETGRKRGRPRKDGAPPGSAAAPASSTTNKPRPVPRPKFSVYSNESPRPDDRSQAAWNWIAALSPMDKSRCLAYAYREWPVLKDPLPGDYKYIDKIMAADMPTSDEELARRYGCGDYKLTFLQTTPDNQELCQIRVANCGARNLVAFPPVDRRISDNSQVDMDNKSNKSYVEYLRGRGLLPEQMAGIKKEAEMAEQSLVSGVFEQNNRLMERVLDNTRAPESPNAVDSKATEIMADAASRASSLMETTFTKLLDKATTPASGSDPVASAIEIARLLIGAQGPKNEEVRKLELQLEEERRRREEDNRARMEENHRRDMEALRTEIQRISNPANSSVPTTGVDSIVETITKKVLDDLDMDGVAKAAAPPWWVQPALEQGLPLVSAILARFLAPSAQPHSAPGVPPPPPGYQSGQPVQPTPAALPAPQAQPQVNQEAIQVHALLGEISAPLIQHLGDTELDGDDFADQMIADHGKIGYMRIARFPEDEIAQAFRAFPMVAQYVAQVPPERLAKFVSAFKNYNQEAYERKLDAREKADAAKGGAA